MRMVCNCCLIEKDEEEFNWRWKPIKRQRTCRDCQRKRQNDWYARNADTHKANVNAHKLDTLAASRQYIWDYLSTHPCVDCGEADPKVLEFDHVRGEKRMEVTRMVTNGVSIRVIQQEIDKCEVRCANCHRRRTSKEQGYWRSK